MRALCWHGKSDVRVDTVPDPRIEDPRDAIVKITSTCICGSDLHLYDGYMPTMEAATSSATSRWARSSRSAARSGSSRRATASSSPSRSPAATCWFCEQQLYSLCDTSNPNAEIARKAMGQSPAGLLRLFAHAGRLRRAARRNTSVFLTPMSGRSKSLTAFPTRRSCSSPTFSPPATWPPRTLRLQQGDTVAIWGCGPVAQFAIRSAWMLGAGRVIAIDRVPERLEMAEKQGKAETINFDKDQVYDKLMEMTKGRGPDRCIDAVGAEAHAGGRSTPSSTRPRRSVGLATDRAHVLREAILCCRKGGTVSIPGVYIGYPDKLPMGAAMNKGSDAQDGPNTRAEVPQDASEENRGR